MRAGTATGLSTATQTFLAGFNVFDLTFSFNAAGQIIADVVRWFGPSESGEISGNQANSSGTLSSDFPGCGTGAGGLCGTISGAWTETIVSPVPEPATVALLGAGLLGIAAVRRRLI